MSVSTNTEFSELTTLGIEYYKKHLKNLTISLINGASIDCLLDTGFDGALALPRSFVEANSISIVGNETFTAAEGNVD